MEVVDSELDGLPPEELDVKPAGPAKGEEDSAISAIFCKGRGGLSQFRQFLHVRAMVAPIISNYLRIISNSRKSLLF